jgi:hypothetical protein
MKTILTTTRNLIQVQTAFIGVFKSKDGTIGSDLVIIGKLPRCRKVQSLTTFFYSSDIGVQNLYGYAEPAKVSPKEWSQFVRSLPVRVASFNLNPLALTPEVIEEAYQTWDNRVVAKIEMNRAEIEKNKNNL